MADTSNPGRGGVLSRVMPNHYVRIYALLLVLLAVSIVGPTFEILVVTLVTAFGVAAVKAWLVVKHFMHLTSERVIAKLFLAASVLLMALFWGGIAPDVQNHGGRNWENVAAKAAVERGISEPEGYGGEEGYGEEEGHGEEGGYGEEGDHGEAATVAAASLVPTAKSIDTRLPGGYNFVHGAFWLVIVLVLVGTNAVAAILSLGVMILAFETLSSIPVVRRLTEPLLRVLLRLPGAGRIRTALLGSG